MAKIDREFPNPVGLESAKSKLVPVLEKLQADYSKFISDVKWSDDKSSASITGNGFSGNFSITEDKIHVVVDLNFALGMFKGKIEDEIASRVSNIDKDSANA